MDAEEDMGQYGEYLTEVQERVAETKQSLLLSREQRQKSNDALHASFSTLMTSRSDEALLEIELELAHVTQRGMEAELKTLAEDEQAKRAGLAVVQERVRCQQQLHAALKSAASGLQSGTMAQASPRALDQGVVREAMMREDRSGDLQRRQLARLAAEHSAIQHECDLMKRQASDLGSRREELDGELRATRQRHEAVEAQRQEVERANVSLREQVSEARRRFEGAQAQLRELRVSYARMDGVIEHHNAGMLSFLDALHREFVPAAAHAANLKRQAALKQSALRKKGEELRETLSQVHRAAEARRARTAAAKERPRAAAAMLPEAAEAVAVAEAAQLELGLPPVQTPRAPTAPDAGETRSRSLEMDVKAFSKGAADARPATTPLVQVQPDGLRPEEFLVERTSESADFAPAGHFRAAPLPKLDFRLPELRQHCRAATPCRHAATWTPAASTTTCGDDALMAPLASSRGMATPWSHTLSPTPPPTSPQRAAFSRTLPLQRSVGAGVERRSSC